MHTFIVTVMCHAAAVCPIPNGKYTDNIQAKDKAACVRLVHDVARSKGFDLKGFKVSCEAK